MKTNPEKLVRFDWAIKTILRDKANFDILEGFLTALLKEDITVLEILESESNQEYKLKFNRVDLLVKDSQERLMIIEIQNQRESDYFQRILFGVSKAIIEHIEEGSAFYNVKKVISISILYFNLGLGDDYVYHSANEFRGLHSKKLLTLGNRSQLADAHKIFPEYYLINVNKFKDLIAEDLDEWIYMFKHSEVKTEFKAKNIAKARDKLRLMQMSLAERQGYSDFLTDVVVAQDIERTAREDGLEEGREEGRIIGREEGRAEGLEEGREAGREEGREEGLAEGKRAAALELARKLLANGISIEQVVQLTGIASDKL
ncbi:Rpn family recombination-promoting nuclease/putative transposase [Beggiatoa leptomitoformis]|uniref:Rpn family recombination-promoting nuclease/putative transposase n=1 Tax=Beggiatoa leptomitoformis TaxID=288004 RepID=A0A2N9YDH6_9GAMM|nr:Rpn family recombination-promoting nuclease/putative transposase [Beggiatoa leptomitoformis]ALG69054.1 Rpn family recombination-promoting nuclease/putative transposase [Beggiatoa leptomitoformis]AUI68537.1 Rpn family recombination-promoting nuclease/putative transposase [Beggiatoa leptomitoformis]